MAAGGHTDEHTEELTFGRLLNSIRTQKGIDLKTISDETRIVVSTLSLLEKEAYDELPDLVFVKGFLKSYAEAIDTPAAPIIQKYIDGRNYHIEKKRIEAGRGKTGASTWPWLALAAFIIVCILYAVLRPAPSQDDERRSGMTGSHADTAAHTDLDRLPEVAASSSPQKSEASQNAYRLQIEAVEETWLKIIVDRQDPKAYSLNPGDMLELKATSGFNLMIGNATGIRLKLNNESIAVQGEHGQVVFLKLPQ